MLVADGALRIIDFDDFGPGYFLFDLVTALFWYQPHPGYGQFQDALFAGYRSVRELDPEHLKLWPALRLARGASYLGWAAEREGQDDSDFILENLLPLVLRLAENYPKGLNMTTTSTDNLLARRHATVGTHSPLFYSEPLSLSSAEGVWITATDGTRYLDGYNNVPHVGHCNPTVVEAARAQGLTLNLHSRYLNEPMVDFAEKLLATFPAPLDKVFFTNTGSESNELALRLARQHTGNRGVLVSDFSYHGNTTSLAEMTTGLSAREGLGAHARPIHIPDLEHADGLDEETLTARALAQVDEAIASLNDAGFGLSAALFDPLFSTEGLNRVPRGYVSGLVAARARRRRVGHQRRGPVGLRAHGRGHVGLPAPRDLPRPGHPGQAHGQRAPDGRRGDHHRAARGVRCPQHVLQHLRRQPGLRGDRHGRASGDGGTGTRGELQGARRQGEAGAGSGGRRVPECGRREGHRVVLRRGDRRRGRQPLGRWRQGSDRTHEGTQGAGFPHRARTTTC